MLPLIKLLRAYRLKWFGAKYPVKQIQFMNKSYWVTDGAVRPKADQGDAWYFELCLNAHSIFDIGANTGATGILALQNKNLKRLTLVDPNPLALTQAAGNLIRNGISPKVNFVNAFVGEEDGASVKFYTLGTGEAGSFLPGHAQSASASNSFYYVPSRTIDSIVDEVGFIPDFAKIDVEGAENLVLKGSTGLAAKQSTLFMVELHAPPELPMVENATFVIKWCKENKYTPWYLRDKVVLKTSDQVADRGKCHILLVPEGKEFPSYLSNIQERAAFSNS
jgi:FkbM family methyltransferase